MYEVLLSRSHGKRVSTEDSGKRSPRICRGGNLLVALARVDAVCININQADNEGEERQVGLMRDVYKIAHGVVISLGEPSGNINRAMDAIYPLYKAYQSARNAQKVFTPAMSSLQHVGELLCHPYFSRIWVVQEVAAASCAVRIICGDRAVLSHTSSTCSVGSRYSDTNCTSEASTPRLRAAVSFPSG